VISRRSFLHTVGGAAAALPLAKLANADALARGLSDPARQPKFRALAPNALDPSFMYEPAPNTNEYTVNISMGLHSAGLVNRWGRPLRTPIFGYGDNRGPTWPGRTFEVHKNSQTIVNWKNRLPNQHLFPVDTSLHWAYSDPSRGLTIQTAGVPIVTHLHGGHNGDIFDGNPEFWYAPGPEPAYGPSWDRFNGGAFTDQFEYDNDQFPGTLWYHDHALGITRLNVYAGMAGFYILRDDQDKGVGNELGLPAFPYELAYAIQDRMFKSNGELFYPALPGDPFYSDFIEVPLRNPIFPGGGATALAEFFGDHMVVNGQIWPKTDVEPRHYRMRLLNGCDSRFLGVRFRPTALDATDLNGALNPVPFTVIGSDQGLAPNPISVTELLMGPGERYDIVIDFTSLTNRRIIMENIGSDAPFGGELGRDPADLFPDSQTDRIMAFDVTQPLDDNVPNNFDQYSPPAGGFQWNPSGDSYPVRQVALFEGSDPYGRLQPMLGTAGDGSVGAMSWSQPTTENPGLNTTEVWEIYNATGDAHPIHLHLVHFTVLNREGFTCERVDTDVPQHDGSVSVGYKLENIQLDGNLMEPTGVEKAPKDTVTARPDEVTRIRATFDKPGRYVWHCHILSHEDHEMMRPLYVGAGEPPPGEPPEPPVPPQEPPPEETPPTEEPPPEEQPPTGRRSGRRRR
jgi:spore coat protein A